MPAAVKPLFRPEAVRSRLASFSLPPDLGPARAALAKWAKLLNSGQPFKETQQLPEFLSDLFGGLLGCVSMVQNFDRYTFGREQHVTVDGKFADGVLGEFGPGGRRFVAAVEGKGPLDPLDVPFAGRKRSAVEQGYQYAINLPCDWIVLTNFR